VATRVLSNSGIVKVMLALWALSCASQDAPFQIAVKVNLVVLHATVRDASGQAAHGLRSQDFNIYEDGVLQQIRLFRHEDTPVAVGLVIDHSGSMQSKLPEVIVAAQTFVRSSRADDEMFVINFNEKVTEPLLMGNRIEGLASAILRTPPAGMTALYDATVAGFERLQTARLEKRALIVISDGGDNASVRRKDDVMQAAAQSTALVYTIGIFDSTDPDRNPRVLRDLARATGGEAYFPATQKDIVPICETIARDIRNQYTLGYNSSNTGPKPGYRRIRVTARPAASDMKLTVRARAGYAIAR
jgi:Ca-activated chloride channel homolog